MTFAAPLPALAQVTIPQEYEKTVQAKQVIGALGMDLFGESTSFYTGATSFSALDVSLPGNSGLPMEIRRQFVVESRDSLDRNRLLTRDGGFADWELDLPHLRGVFAYGKGWQVNGTTTAARNQRCAGGNSFPPEPPIADGSPSGFWAAAEYWQGNHLHLPAGGDQEMLLIENPTSPRPNDGKTYVWITENLWAFSCLTGTANGVAGDAFLAVAPDGTRYWFNWVAKREVAVITKTVGGPIDALAAQDASVMAAPGGTGSGLMREEVRFLPTRVEDKAGNYITYTYDPAKPWRLLSMAANDGRSLTMTYDAAGHISTVTDGTRTWTYTYGNGLTEVTLPDQSRWQIDFAGLRDAFTMPYSPGGLMCSESGASTVQSVYTGTITHPSGAIGTFSFQSRTHGRSYVPKVCVRPGGIAILDDYAQTPFLFNTVGIIQKKIEGPGVASPYIWTYSYGAPNNSWEENCASGCVATKTVEVTGPDEWKRYTFGNRYRQNEGRLLKTESGTSPTNILEVEETVYQTDPTGQLYPGYLGASLYTRGDYMAGKLTPVKTRTIKRQGTGFTYTANSYDQYARPVSVTKSSAPAP
ncbi:RHS repeat protein [Pseudoxanthomonas beigongshangi]|uniref:RHS repeat protein n=1 Tax=Pseudoxanthomonas beigongshangi TaxID=2782537 RepID=UPI00193B2130|nr:RHS repeat protein [Pseudoxanthomonas beigongshangi]